MNSRQTRRRLVPTVGGLLVLAVLAAVIAAGSGAAGTRPAAEPPKNLSPPTISGTPEVGQTLKSTPGKWNVQPTGFLYQWRRCDKGGNSCANIGGAESKDYTLTSADVGNTVRVRVKDRTPDGEASATSAPTAEIKGAPKNAPKKTASPTISGTPKQGETLTVSNGSWTGAQPITYSYQWLRCNDNGDACADISGAKGQTYKLGSADVGNTLRARVMAKNADGVNSATTVPSAKIAKAAAATTTTAPAKTTPKPPAPPPAPKNPCSGSGPVAAGSVALPTRLLIDRFTFSPSVLTGSAQQFVARIHISDTCGRSVSGAQLWATAIPYNQTSLERGSTAGDGWGTLTFQMLSGFPANPGRQQILALLVRATQPGGSVLAGVSTRRVLAVRVNSNG